VIRPTLIGNDVYLRPVERADIDRGWHDWVNDPFVTHGLQGYFPTSREGIESYYEASKPPHAALFAICMKEDDTYIGNARLGEFDWINRVCIYGRLLGNRDYQGHGYGTEVLILLLRYGFHILGFNRIWSAAVSANKVSLASNDRVGMLREGIQRQSIFKNGEFVDGVVLAMLREGFDEKHGSPEEWESSFGSDEPMPRRKPRNK
jgi:[ribosomal protein S5]-alanine N-acetyltransferase